jgi:hypothetical protein
LHIGTNKLREILLLTDLVNWDFTSTRLITGMESHIKLLVLELVTNLKFIIERAFKGTVVTTEPERNTRSISQHNVEVLYAAITDAE